MNPPSSPYVPERASRALWPLRQSAQPAYALATGEAAAHRLRILHDVYGPGTRRVLIESGIRPGMRVADLGCGVGLVTALLAALVRPDGHVVGIDASHAQLTEARKRLDGSATNVSLVESSATDTGLPAESFDLVFCRFLLIHLRHPEQALLEMLRLIKPGGILVCEDGYLTACGSEPPSALDAFADLWGRLGPERGLDYTLGRRLFQMVLAAGSGDQLQPAGVGARRKQAPAGALGRRSGAVICRR
jgi:SAM-dependent methyltransferase